VADTRASIKDGMRGVQSTHNGIKGVLTSVYKEGGVRGLYRGAGMYVTGSTKINEIGFCVGEIRWNTYLWR